jgi:hypothetical protein
MVDEFKTIRDNLFKAITGLGASVSDDSDDSDEDISGPRLVDAKATRALLQALFARAGKGKDEVVQIIAREIGMAVAAMLKEPLSQLAKHQKLQISFEFVPKTQPASRRAAAGTADVEDEAEEDVDETEEVDEVAEGEEVDDAEEEEEAEEPPRRSRAKRAPRSRPSSRRKSSRS